MFKKEDNKMSNINIQIIPEEKKCLISTEDTQQMEYFCEEMSDLLIALDAFCLKHPIF